MELTQEITLKHGHKKPYTHYDFETQILPSHLEKTNGNFILKLVGILVKSILPLNVVGGYFDIEYPDTSFKTNPDNVYVLCNIDYKTFVNTNSYVALENNPHFKWHYSFLSSTDQPYILICFDFSDFPEYKKCITNGQYSKLPEEYKQKIVYKVKEYIYPYPTKEVRTKYYQILYPKENEFQKLASELGVNQSLIKETLSKNKYNYTLKIKSL